MFMPNEKSQTGFAFAYDKAEFDQFSATFPYEETDDQKIAINAVISDMCQAKAMDRLVCGDVGFGKTEVAIRATFLAVMNHKQVVILAQLPCSPNSIMRISKTVSPITL